MALKGTTPTFILTVPDTVDLTEATNVYASFGLSTDAELLRKTGDDISVSEHQVDVYLSQEETLALPTGKILVQLNWTYQQGANVLRDATEPAAILFKPNMINEVLE